MFARLLPVLLVLLPFSGCLEPEVPTPPAPVAPVSIEPGPRLANGSLAPLTLAYTDCTEHLGVLPIPMDIASELPEGFTPVAFDPAGQFASIVVVTYACHIDGAPVNEFNIGLQVETPPAYASADARLHLLILGALTDRPENLDILGAWGAQASLFLAEISVGLDGPSNPLLRRGVATAVIEGETLELTTTVPAVGGTPEAAGFARLLYLDDEEATIAGIVDFHWTASSQGSATGTSSIAFDGEPAPPVLEGGGGIAFHYWGSYDYEARYVPLP